MFLSHNCTRCNGALMTDRQDGDLVCINCGARPRKTIRDIQPLVTSHDVAMFQVSESSFARLNRITRQADHGWRPITMAELRKQIANSPSTKGMRFESAGMLNNG